MDHMLAQQAQEAWEEQPGPSTSKKSPSRLGPKKAISSILPKAITKSKRGLPPAALVPARRTHPREVKTKSKAMVALKSEELNLSEESD